MGPISTGGQPAPPVLLYPSWMDSRFVQEVSYPAPALDLNYDGTNEIQIPGDAERWCIGFTTPQGAFTIFVAPWARSNVWPFAVLLAQTTVWFPLAIYGPLVCAPWYVMGNANGAPVRVTQILRS